MASEPNNTIKDFDFFKLRMPESRKADFYLGCFEGCVFLDFNSTSDKRINLCRISFDGFGCCNIDKAKCLNEQSSREFITEIRKENLDQGKITGLVLELVRLNKDSIWEEALEHYNLID